MILNFAVAPFPAATILPPGPKNKGARARDLFSPFISPACAVFLRTNPKRRPPFVEISLATCVFRVSVAISDAPLRHLESSFVFLGVGLWSEERLTNSFGAGGVGSLRLRPSLSPALRFLHGCSGCSGSTDLPISCPFLPLYLSTRR